MNLPRGSVSHRCFIVLLFAAMWKVRGLVRLPTHPTRRQSNRQSLQNLGKVRQVSNHDDIEACRQEKYEELMGATKLSLAP